MVDGQIATWERDSVLEIVLKRGDAEPVGMRAAWPPLPAAG